MISYHIISYHIISYHIISYLSLWLPVESKTMSTRAMMEYVCLCQDWRLRLGQMEFQIHKVLTGHGPRASAFLCSAFTTGQQLGAFGEDCDSCGELQEIGTELDVEAEGMRLTSRRSCPNRPFESIRGRFQGFRERFGPSSAKPWTTSTPRTWCSTTRMRCRCCAALGTPGVLRDA